MGHNCYETNILSSLSMCTSIQRVWTFSFSTSCWCGGRGWQGIPCKVPVVKYCEIRTIFCLADIHVPLVAGWHGKLCYIASWDMANNIDSWHLHDRVGLASPRFTRMLTFNTDWFNLRWRPNIHRFTDEICLSEIIQYPTSFALMTHVPFGSCYQQIMG